MQKVWVVMVFSFASLEFEKFYLSYHSITKLVCLSNCFAYQEQKEFSFFNQKIILAKLVGNSSL